MPSRIESFSNTYNLAGSVSVWASLHALKFRNPEDKRSGCESLSRRIAVELIAFPVLIIASLVEGIVRGTLGLVHFGLGRLASLHSPALEWTICPPHALVYTIAGGIASLTNCVNLIYLLWANMQQGDEKIEYKNLILDAP